MSFVTTLKSVPALASFDSKFSSIYLQNQKPGIHAIELLNNIDPYSRVYMFYLKDYRYYCDFEVLGDNWGDDGYTQFIAAGNLNRHKWLLERSCKYLMITSDNIEKYHMSFPRPDWWHIGTFGPVELWHVLDTGDYAEILVNLKKYKSLPNNTALLYTPPLTSHHTLSGVHTHAK